MILVYFENGKHITLNIEKIETCINYDELIIIYYEEGKLKEKFIDKENITSINIRY